MFDDADLIAKNVRLAVRRARHNALADVEEFCTGTVARVKKYAPLLQHIAVLKDALRQEMKAIDAPFGDSG